MAANRPEFSVTHQTPSKALATVTIPASFVDALFHEAASSQVDKAHTRGFAYGSTPVEYIKEHFKPKLTEHLQEFLFKYAVLSFLFRNIDEHKLLVVGEPHIESIRIVPHEPATYTFALSMYEPMDFYDWKLLPFKPPKRKNYKDIDRQVEMFIKQEVELSKLHREEGIRVGDWVLFDISLVDNKKKPLFAGHTEQMWLRIGEEEVDAPLAKLFGNKTIGEQFYTNDQSLQDYFSNELTTNYTFSIKILEVVSCTEFSFDRFKRHFRLRNNKDMHNKFIEIFSYRDDISQRRLMVDEMFRTMFKRHPFEVPKEYICRREELVLKDVLQNPDYQVYKNERAFKENIQDLAEKQLRELIIVDVLKYRENVQATPQDVMCYLGLAQRPRTKEFLYFDSPDTKVHGQEVPFPSELLRHLARREKTINFIIYYLTKSD